MDFVHLFTKKPFCKGLIIVGPGDTHFMLPTIAGWNWFNQITTGHWIRGAWFPCYYIPMISVNASIGKWLIDNDTTDSVNGFIDQKYEQQTIFGPGVKSYNVVAYRNISHSPNNAIVILSNRIDNWWNQGPGDSGNGGAILLGIAKYLKDNNIIPKYNLAFLFTTGEEYGMRGAQHFIDTHPNGTGAGEYNYLYWIGLDQLAFNLTEQGKTLQTQIRTNPTMRPLLRAIANQTDYKKRVNYAYDFDVLNTTGGGTEDATWKHNVNASHTIVLGKENGWLGWHCAGNKYHEGDSWKISI